jgi:cytochrome c5
MSEHHEPFIKTPKQLAVVVALALFIPILVIVLLTRYVDSGLKTGAGSAANTPEAIAARIKPVGQLELKDANAPKVLKTGEAVYQLACAACHEAGAAGAPKFGDAGLWAKRVAQGAETLIAHAIKGYNAMPAKGGNADLDDVEVARAVVYMANKVGANFKEPVVKEVKETAIPAKEEAKQDVAKVETVAAAPTVVDAKKDTKAEVKSEAKVDGKAIYDKACMACHATGAAGAPKFADKAAWAPRIKQGVDVLHQHAIAGIRAMPAKGGNPALSDAEVKASVDYMVGAAK